MEGNKWQQMLDNMKSQSGGKFFFPGDGKTRFRIVPQGGKGDAFFAETKRVFRGKERVRFVILGVVAGATKRDIPEDMQKKVVPIVVTKTVIQGILALLAEDWDLLGKKEGHGLTLTRSGTGLDTSYSLTPSAKAIPLPDDLEFPEQSLEELATEFYANSLDRDSKRDDEGDAKGKGKGSRSSKSSGDEPAEDW